jgi:transposase-like protein
MSESKLKNRRSFTPEFKLKIAVQIVSGQRSVAELSREHSIKDSVLSRWRDQFLERAGQIFAPSPTESERIAQLEREIGRQHMELEILKKASKTLL